MCVCVCVCARACVWGGVCVSTSTYKGSGGGLVAKLCRTLVTSWTVACQAPLSMGFSRPEYWSELPFSSPGDLPDPGIEPRSSKLQADSLLAELQGKPYKGRRNAIFHPVAVCIPFWA